MGKGLALALIISLLFMTVPVTIAETAAAAGTTFAAYEFNEDGNLEGWMNVRNGVERFAVADGALQLKLNQADPFWYGPRPFGLQATEDQTVTIRMKSTKGTSVAIYFDTDLYPGLSQAKRILIPITADGEYHEYVVKAGAHPNWRGIVNNFRLDLEPADSVPSDVSIDYVRIGDQSAFGYEFNGSASGWTSAGGLSELQAGAASVSAAVYGDGVPTIVSGPVDQLAEDVGMMKLRTRVVGGAAEAVKVQFTTDASPEWSEQQQLIVPASLNGEFQDAVVGLWEHPLWAGTIRQLRISLEGAGLPEGAVWETDYIRFSSVRLPHYHWNDAGDAQGWIPIHHLTDFKAANGVLSARVTGSDPHLGHDNVEGVIGERDKTLTVRMSATAGSFVSIFFATDEAPFFAETRRFDFTITADGQMRDYTIAVGDHPSWKGKIIKFRMDLEGGDRTNAVIALDDVAFVSSPVGSDIGIKRSKPALHVGEEADITVDIANTGGKAFFDPSAELIVSEGLEVVGDAVAAGLPDLRPGDKASVTWKVRAVSERPSSVAVKLQASGYAQTHSVALPVVKPYAAAVGERPDGARAYIEAETGHAVIENENTRLVAVKSDYGYGQYQVYAWAGDQGWKRMASAQPFASAVVREAGNRIENVAFDPSQAAAGEEAGRATLRFQGTAADASGRQWSYSFDFSLGDGDSTVQTRQDVSADRGAELLNLNGPVLTVGEGAFGGGKEEALFPGLEWLVGDEASSSRLDVHTPAYLRLKPHPYKITVPLMAVKQGGHLVSLNWDPHQKWDGVNELPAAKFASPNWVENQNNHLMGLSALSVPTWVKENGELAHTAYPLAAGRSIRLEAGITTAEAESVADAVSLYVKEHPLPGVPQVRPFEEKVDLGLDAYLRTYWVPEAKGWRHVNIPSWGSNQYPSDMVSLKLLGMSAPERKPEIERVLSEALGAMENKGRLGEPDYHIPQFQAPFYVGYMEEALAGLKAEIETLMAEQVPSGAWEYDEQDRYNPPLGLNGTPLVGQTALNAKHLLRYAQMTGDAQAEAAGFKGLAAFEAMGHVPRGSQPWEVPLRTPDILAAGHAVGLYVQAYEMTGDESYLEKAAKWAEAGMPFVYTWGVDGLPMMEYGTIPIFGASAYINPWFAVPVQWNGLVYAYELLNLAEHDASGPWKQLADGILASGEIQQASDAGEPVRGGYPDNWRLISNSRSDTVMLNPEEIVKVMYKQRDVEGLGPNPDVRTTVIAGCPETSSAAASDCSATRVTSLAEVTDAGPSDTSHLVKFRLTYPAGETTYVLVAGRGRPKKVTVNDVALAPSGDLTPAAEGWSYSAETGYLLLKVKHSAADEVHVHY